MENIYLSTITPVYNGAKYLPELVKQLSEFKTQLKDYEPIKLVESIFVLDSPIDNSAEVLEELNKKYDWVKVITLSKNFGQHPATIAGILHSSGDWLVSLDEDLQHRPKDILKLLAKTVREKADVCYANPKKNTHASIVKDYLARWFKKSITIILGNKNVQYFNSFRLIRGNIGRAAASVCRHETYFDIALSWFTNRVCYVLTDLIDNRNQSNEGSGYTLWGLVRHAKRMLMSSKIKFLRIGIPIGILAFFLSLGLGAYALLSRLMNVSSEIHRGWASTILVILFFSGLISLLIGFTLETVSDLLVNANGKPTYFTIDRSKDEKLKEVLKKIDLD